MKFLMLTSAMLYATHTLCYDGNKDLHPLLPAIGPLDPVKEKSPQQNLTLLGQLKHALNTKDQAVIAVFLQNVHDRQLFKEVDTDNFTALHLVALYGDLGALKILDTKLSPLKLPTNPYEKKTKKDQRTPLDLAIIGGHADITKYLFDERGFKPYFKHLEISHSI